MRSHRTHVLSTLAVTLGFAVVTLSPAPASAAGSDPLGDLLGGVTSAVKPKAAAPPASDSDLPGNETKNPSGADHGSSRGVEVTIGDQPVAAVGQDNATVRGDDSTRADSTLLSLGGQEILGTHADSRDTEESQFGDPLMPLCEGSDGAVCLSVLYADAWATDDGTTSYSRSQSGVADACLFGSDDPAADCDGPIQAGAMTSEGEAGRNQNSGRSTASSQFEAARLCLAPDAETGCAIGATVLHSSGDADSGGSSSSANRESYLAVLVVGGTSLGRVSDPTDLSIQPACAEPSLLCVFLNQGETYLGSGTAGHAQDALKATLLPGELDLFVGVGHTETLVHNDGGNLVPDISPELEGRVLGVSLSADNGILPDTGGPMSILLLLGLLGVAGGSFAVAYGRRVGVTHS